MPSENPATTPFSPPSVSARRRSRVSARGQRGAREDKEQACGTCEPGALFLDSVGRPHWQWRRPVAAGWFPSMNHRLRETSAAIADFRSARLALGLSCPHCASDRIVRWGSFSARQRYRCISCRRTFSDLTGTPAAHIKKIERLRSYAGTLVESASIRRAARAVGVAPSTAFRWRHRLVGHLAMTDRATLRGWIELTTCRLPESFKGQRALPRPPRRRGPRPATLPASQVCVVVALDRTSRLSTDMVRRPRVASTDLIQVLGARVRAGALVLAAEGPLSASGIFARKTGGTFRDARVAHRRLELDHVENARGYVGRMKDWLSRFRGVATSYLTNYLAWHRALDCVGRHRIDERVLRWPVAAWGPANSIREQSPRAPGRRPDPGSQTTTEPGGPAHRGMIEGF